MSALVQCPGCARHIRAHEAQCPFCSTVTRARPPSQSSATSALFVAAMSVAASGCSVLCEAVSVPGICAERRRPNVDSPAPVYGGPPLANFADGDAGVATSSPTPRDFDTPRPVYGLPRPPIDPASPGGATRASVPNPQVNRPPNRYGGPRRPNENPFE